jgi:hypothetical protein
VPVVDSRTGVVLLLLVWLSPALLLSGLALAMTRKWPWVAAAVGWLVVGLPVAEVTVLAVL